MSKQPPCSSQDKLTRPSSGTWVAHPALAKIATEVFNQYMPTPNQIFNRREEITVSSMDLLNMNMPGGITEDGISKNIEIGLSYMEGWLRAVGCVPINYLMEDAATAEVSRSQVRRLGGCW